MTIDHKNKPLSKSIKVQVEDSSLEGNLEIPEGASGLVIFVHGSGSSRHSPRNHFVAKALQEAGLATFLVDLLSEEEEKHDRTHADLRFDINFLADRLVAITSALKKVPEAKTRAVGYFGSSTGAAAALVAAASTDDIKAVVSRGGRPDLAMDILEQVKCPTLLIVGGADEEVVRLNQRAFARLESEKALEIIPDATHLFEEAGALEKVAKLAGTWFSKHL